MLLSRDEPDNSEKKTWQKLFIKPRPRDSRHTDQGRNHPSPQVLPRRKRQNHRSFQTRSVPDSLSSQLEKESRERQGTGASASVQSRVCRDQAYSHGCQIPQSASHPIDQPCASVGLHAYARRPCHAPVLAGSLQSPTPKARTRSAHRPRHRPPQDLFPLRCLHPHLLVARNEMIYTNFYLFRLKR